MENAQIINILNIPFLEIECEVVPLGQEVECIKSFGLGFCDWWNVWTAGLVKETCESATGVLDYNSFWGGFGSGCVVQKRADCVWL